MVDVLLSGKQPALEDENYISSFEKIDRKDFVPEEFKNIAYDDKDIIFFNGEKLSKPTTIAKQISLLEPKAGQRLLEIGAGTGYLSAILADIVGKNGKIFAVDRIFDILTIIRKNLAKYPHLTGIVEPVFKDGTTGYVEEAPYDGILVSTIFDEVPEQLKQQLNIKGRIVMPTQNYEYKIITRVKPNQFVQKLLPGVLFDKSKQGVD